MLLNNTANVKQRIEVPQHHACTVHVVQNMQDCTVRMHAQGVPAVSQSASRCAQTGIEAHYNSVITECCFEHATPTEPH